MNPPSAIQNAMGRERKPFTYTPGGLDLSEIKSERMARRLMRNAMSQGVPEAAAPSIQSPSVHSTPVAIPNYNCLPVQKEVKVVKKQVKKDKKSEEIRNEDNDTEAELTVQLAPKKSSAKTETSVEVVQKVGPDGEVEEIKTTTTKTTVNGKTEVTTKTETKKIPAQIESEEEEVVEEEEEEEEIEEKPKEETNSQKKTTTVVKQQSAASDEEEKDAVIKENETHEVTTTKKVVVVQKTSKKEESEEEEEIEEEEENEEEEQEEEVEEEEEKSIRKKQRKEVNKEKKRMKKKRRNRKSKKKKKKKKKLRLEIRKETRKSPHETISKSHIETTEIRSTINEALGRPVSTQTELHRIENLVTVNRTTKTLDQAYEQITQHGVPTVKTYFAPSRDRVSTSPQPARSYQSSYTPEPTTERRHSLLLERLSTERQIPPPDTYHSTYQTLNSQSYESNQNQWSQEPQSEVINVSNVKPSSITNQQWYQQSRKDNVIYNNVASTIPEPAPTIQTAPQWTPSTHTESYTQDYSKTSTTDFTQSGVPNYTPKPNTWGSSNLGQINTLPTINTPSNQYSFLSKDSTDSYQKSTQQYSSTYVPPPWETDVNYAAKMTDQNYYQPPPQTSTFVPGSTSGWKPTPPPTKFSKPAPTSYQPPKPNQSFVMPVVAQPPKIPGRKTYYSEYERRYISVPESTYIPTETKYQPQPDPSPQYYYDNNEPIENVEHTWRKELREFTEKTSQTQYQVQESAVKPPWEEDAKYGKAPTATYTPTPTWSQTLRPRSWRERSFESELNTQEWPKSNTLGRGRPVSSYVNTNKESLIPEKPRGVSVDRYNPSSYTSPLPAEHPPAQTYTLSPTPPAKLYHNPNVPAYHSRASAEPREHPVTHPRTFKEPRSSPIQSRSFKYLQWITGTED
ncbi:hypothetical protein EVAR_732_1 [Eumeta japonica]|uniref:Uncharacterized protein n=1 Tax=Eumeta variegata TaxID=151549 RepID=A0A4C1SER0_EUMVA|nr:hypothetical protein EVAR_732_1 [Eumeta japonica]